VPKLTLTVTWPEPEVEIDWSKKPTVETRDPTPEELEQHRFVANIFIPLKPVTICSQTLEIDFATQEELDAGVAFIEKLHQDEIDKETPSDRSSRWLLHEVLKQQEA